MTSDEIWRAIDDQRLRLVGLLETLTEDDWRTPSLCRGWTVRDVAAHLTFAQSTWPEIVVEMARHRSIRASAVHRAATLPVEEVIGRIRSMVGSRRHIAAVTERETLIDILVHSQDIAIPLGREFALDPAAATAAAERVWAMGYPFWARRRHPDLRPGPGTLLRLTGRDIPSR